MDPDGIPIPDEAAGALRLVQGILSSALSAVYLHGSAVAGGLRPASDVDVLAVTDRMTTPAIRKRLSSELMRISGSPGSKDQPRPIELILIHIDDLHPAAYPRRAEFIYGEWLRETFEAGAIPQPVSDPELSIVLAQARETSKTLHGSDPGELLPEFGEDELRRAITDALPQLLATIRGDERNVLLTLARMWRTQATGEIVPKDVAAAWAGPHLSREAAEVVGHARDGYLGIVVDNWTRRERSVARAVDELRRRIEAAS